MFYIYKITNLINQKIYIGKTCRDINTRWNEHCSCANNNADNFYFHNAIAKYGKDNFLVEEIDKTNDIDMLNQLECKYIKQYNATNHKYGYNLTNGGDGNRQYNWDEIRQMWDNGYAVKDIIHYLQCDKGTVSDALKNYNNYTPQLSLRRSNANSKPINQYDLNKKLINTYPSIAEAARVLKCNEMTIFNSLKTNHYALNYYWTYQNESLPADIKHGNSTKKRQINQYDLNNNLLYTFNSAADAARSVRPQGNINSVSGGIIQVCKNKRKTAYGYKWAYAEQE